MVGFSFVKIYNSTQFQLNFSQVQTYKNNDDGLQFNIVSKLKSRVQYFYSP